MQKLMDRPPRFRRRHFFIDRHMQGRFVAGLTLAVLVAFFLNMALAYFLIDRELTSGLYKIHLKVRSTSEIAGPILWKLGAVTIPLILAVAAAAGYLLTRRFEGPLLAFRRFIKEMAGGDFTTRLDADAPDRLAEAFGGMGAALSERFRTIRSGVEGLEKTFSSLEVLITGPPGSLGSGAAAAKGREASKREMENVLGEISAGSGGIGRELARLRL